MKRNNNFNIEFKKALDIVRKEIKKDEELYYAYQANIAVQFQDEMRSWEEKNNIQPISNEALHEISNNAAKNFLDLWVKQ